MCGCGRGSFETGMRKGIRLVEKGETERARKQFSALLDQELITDRERALVENVLGLMEQRAGNEAEAEQRFARSMELDPLLPDPAYNLALLRLNQGRQVEAEEWMVDAARRDPEDPRALEWLGHMRMKEGRVTEARQALSEAMNRSGSSPRILTALANMELKEGRASDAVTYLMQALELETDYPPALYNLGVIYRDHLNDPDQSQAAFEDYLEVAETPQRISQVRAELGMAVADTDQEPSATDSESTQTVRQDPETRPLTPAEQTEALLNRARQFKERGQNAAALNYCLLAANRAGDNLSLREKALRTGVDLCFEMGRAHHQLGQFLERTGREEAALRSYKQAVALDPDTQYFHLDLAALALKLNEADAALASLTQARDLDPNDAETAWQIASLYDAQEMTRKAIEAYSVFLDRFQEDPRTVRAAERIRDLRPSSTPQMRTGPVARRTETASEPPLSRNPEAAVQAFNRGTLYLQREDFERAVFFFRRATELDPLMTRAYFNLGFVFQRQGRLGEAVEIFKQAIDLQPTLFDAYYNLALVYHDAGRLQEAINSLQTLLRKNPEYARAYYLAAVIFSKNPRQNDQARRYYTQFLQFAESDDPYVPAAQQWLQQNAP